MSYSQKYCLVSFIKPVDIGYEFIMEEWPLHITLADVFAIERHKSNIDNQLAKLLQTIEPVHIEANDESILGPTRVVLIKNNSELQNLHDSIINLLENIGAIFNSPEFTHEGFLPHCTIQKINKLNNGQIVKINSLALIDMYVDSDWKKRKVLNIFNLKSKS